MIYDYRVGGGVGAVSTVTFTEAGSQGGPRLNESQLLMTKFSDWSILSSLKTPTKPKRVERGTTEFWIGDSPTLR